MYMSEIKFGSGGSRPARVIIAMTKERESTDSLSQLEKFKKAARELECDEDEALFKKRLSRLVKSNDTKGEPQGD